MELPEIETVERVKLDPGDVVIVRFKGVLSPPVVDRVAEQLKATFPDNKVLVLDDGAALDVVTPA